MIGRTGKESVGHGAIQIKARDRVAFNQADGIDALIPFDVDRKTLIVSINQKKLIFAVWENLVHSITGKHLIR